MDKEASVSAELTGILGVGATLLAGLLLTYRLELTIDWVRWKLS